MSNGAKRLLNSKRSPSHEAEDYPILNPFFLVLVLFNAIRPSYSVDAFNWPKIVVLNGMTKTPVSSSKRSKSSRTITSVLVELSWEKSRYLNITHVCISLQHLH